MKSDLGFNEALMNGSQTSAAITQSQGRDTAGRAKSYALLVHGRDTVLPHFLRLDSTLTYCLKGSLEKRKLKMLDCVLE